MRIPTKKIPLTQGYAAIIDAADFELVSQYSWHVQFTKGIPYALTRLKAPSRKYVPLHRLLTGAQLGQYVRFNNRNTLDCRRKNLAVPHSTSVRKVA